MLTLMLTSLQLRHPFVLPFLIIHFHLNLSTSGGKTEPLAVAILGMAQT
jgi:hypothetical protein